ncbi:hypothetical protein JYU34_006236 [Plutella xylostella]|uniref:Nose resistant-to-fluoxetine protein N-terminal domain-containing protein n=1 Tax=Plutella xylostella TaxID=51655 RepID=A0ABQ7QV78_PLUXY|nr:hypothetical protein JYU34_006236 [Plutella xylostella]
MEASVVLVVLFLAAAVRGQVFDYELYEQALDEAECERQLDYLRTNFSATTIKFLDASGKIPVGVTAGNMHDLGDYFMCLRISEQLDDMWLRGKWCAVIVPLDQLQRRLPARRSRDHVTTLLQLRDMQREEANLKNVPFIDHVDNRVIPSLTATTGLTLGVCVPRACRAARAVGAALGVLGPLGRNITVNESFCRLPEDKPYVAADYVAFGVIAVLGAVTVASTSYDVHHTVLKKRHPSSSRALYRSFSLYSNTRRLLTVGPGAPGALDCVDGIRAISMLWVVVGHTFALTLSMPVQNLVIAMEWIRSAASIWLTAATCSVDTFFTLSGVLCVYSTIGKLNRTQFIKYIPLFYLHRLLRMFPLLAAAVLLQASLLHRLGDGPQWASMAWAVQTCRSYWWSALLHIQNFTNVNEMCLGQAWYLSVDVQLYILCPLVLVWLCRPRAPAAPAIPPAPAPRAAPLAPRSATAALAVAVAASLIAVSAYSFSNNWPASMLNFARLRNMSTYMKKYYMNTLSRASPFCVGMVFGYWLHVCRERPLVLRRRVHLPIWAVALTSLALIIYSVYPTTTAGEDKQLLDSFLNSYTRAVWAAAVGWVVLACAQGYGGPINWFLSLRAWKLPARLSYGVYLLHYPLIFLSNSSAIHSHYFSVSESMYRFWADLTRATVAALVLGVAVDAPASALQKMLFTRLQPHGKSQKKTESQETAAAEDISKANV